MLPPSPLTCLVNWAITDDAGILQDPGINGNQGKKSEKITKCIDIAIAIFSTLFYIMFPCSFQQSKAMYVPDVAAIVSDFELMGEGLVHSVEVLSSPPTHSGQS